LSGGFPHNLFGVFKEARDAAAGVPHLDDASGEFPGNLPEAVHLRLNLPDRFFESRLQTGVRSFYGGNSETRRVFSRF
jgi:hypothetical protein